jgi:hypothetical protein
MNKKVIKSILTAKMNDWVKTIKDEKVAALVRKNAIVTGGAIANLLLNEEVKDFDVYFRDKETTLAVAQYYVNDFNERHKGRKNKLGGNATALVLDGERDLMMGNDGKRVFRDKSSPIAKEFASQGNILSRMVAGCTPDRVKIIVRSDGVAAENEEVLNAPFEDAVEALTAADEVNENAVEQSDSEALAKDKYRPVFLSTNAITLSEKVQLVVRFYGEATDIHENYDFVHCTNYFDYGNKELSVKPEALECLLNKELKYQGSKYPLCSIIRTRKFIKRGFHINAGQYLKMCFQVSKLDLTNIDVLEDQLVGVDSAYFMALIDALRSKQEGNAAFRVEENYVASIIDRIF